MQMNGTNNYHLLQYFDYKMEVLEEEWSCLGTNTRDSCSLVHDIKENNYLDDLRICKKSRKVKIEQVVAAVELDYRSEIRREKGEIVVS